MRRVRRDADQRWQQLWQPGARRRRAGIGGVVSPLSKRAISIYLTLSPRTLTPPRPVHFVAHPPASRRMQAPDSEAEDDAQRFFPLRATDQAADQRGAPDGCWGNPHGNGHQPHPGRSRHRSAGIQLRLPHPGRRRGICSCSEMPTEPIGRSRAASTKPCTGCVPSTSMSSCTTLLRAFRRAGRIEHHRQDSASRAPATS